MDFLLSSTAGDLDEPIRRVLNVQNDDEDSLKDEDLQVFPKVVTKVKDDQDEDEESLKDIDLGNESYNNSSKFLESKDITSSIKFIKENFNIHVEINDIFNNDDDDDDNDIKLLQPVSAYEIDNSFTLYGKNSKSNIMIITELKHNDCINFLSNIKNICKDNAYSLNPQKVKTDLLQLLYIMPVRLIMSYTDNKYHHITNDGICGLRLVYAVYKYSTINEVDQMKMSIKSLDVNLRNHEQYTDFFNWIASKYEKAQSLYNRYYDFVMISYPNMPNMLGLNLYSNEAKAIILDFNRSLLNENSILPYKNGFNAEIKSFIDWYISFKSFIDNNRPYDAEELYGGIYVDSDNWFNINHIFCLCEDCDFSLSMYMEFDKATLNAPITTLDVNEQIQYIDMIKKEYFAILTSNHLFHPKTIFFDYNDLKTITESEIDIHAILKNNHYYPISCKFVIDDINEIYNNFLNKLVEDFAQPYTITYDKTKLNTHVLINTLKDNAKLFKKCTKRFSDLIRIKDEEIQSKDEEIQSLLNKVDELNSLIEAAETINRLGTATNLKTTPKPKKTPTKVLKSPVNKK